MVNQLKKIFSQNKKKKVGIIIEARSNSSRLPNKHFLKILNKTMLEHLIYRLKNISNVDVIVIATTKNREDDKIYELAKKINVEYLEEVKIMLLNEFSKLLKISS